MFSFGHFQFYMRRKSRAAEADDSGVLYAFQNLAFGSRVHVNGSAFDYFLTGIRKGFQINPRNHFTANSGNIANFANSSGNRRVNRYRHITVGFGEQLPPAYFLAFPNHNFGGRANMLRHGQNDSRRKRELPNGQAVGFLFVLRRMDAVLKRIFLKI